jgi:hypothetical protein
MHRITILDVGDVINPNDWMRPLYRSADYDALSDSWHETSTYGGGPLDHLKWAPVWLKLGSVWWGSTYEEYINFNTEGSMMYEFVRGAIPKSHALDIDGQWRKRHPLYYTETLKRRDEVMNQLMGFGRHAKSTIEWVRVKYGDYLERAMHKVPDARWEKVKEQIELERYQVYSHPKEYRKFKKPAGGITFDSKL